MAYISQANRMTKCDYVTQQLKEMIITGVYKSGDQLPNEVALCEMFDVSRITVREALKKLNMMGMLDIIQGKGTFVKTVDLSLFMKPIYQLIDFEDIDIEAIYSAREYVESGIAYLAAINRTEQELANMEDILKKLKNSIDKEDIIKVAVFDSAFHLEVAKSARNPILYACMGAIEEINQTCLKRFSKYFTMLENCYDEHFEIFQAIKLKDAEKARQAMVEHTINSKRILK